MGPARLGAETARRTGCGAGFAEEVRDFARSGADHQPLSASGCQAGQQFQRAMIAMRWPSKTHRSWWAMMPNHAARTQTVTTQAPDSSV